MSSLRSALQRLANSAGYRIEKIRPVPPGAHIHLLDYLVNVLNAQRDGHVRLVQIGANDGMLEDPCRAWLARFPWSGVLVEPQASLADGLRAMYADNPRIRIEQTLVSAHNGTAKFYAFTSGEMNAVASMDRSAIETHQHKLANGAITEIELETVTFDRLLERAGMDAVDYLQIDTEGADYSILRTIDLARLRPPLICYEHANLSPDDNIACRAMLAEHGYAFATWLGDTVACQPSLRIVSDDRRDFLLP